MSNLALELVKQLDKSQEKIKDFNEKSKRLERINFKKDSIINVLNSTIGVLKPENVEIIPKNYLNFF